MASESVESNMDREMILADFQVCLFYICPQCVTVSGSGVFRPCFITTDNIDDVTDVVNNRPMLSRSLLLLTHKANILTAC